MPNMYIESHLVVKLLSKHTDGRMSTVDRMLYLWSVKIGPNNE